MDGFSCCKVAIVGPRKFIETILACICVYMGEKTEGLVTTFVTENPKERRAAMEKDGGYMSDVLQALHLQQPELIIFAPPSCTPVNLAESPLYTYYEQLRKMGLPLPLLLAFLPDTAETACLKTLGQGVLAVSAAGYMESSGRLPVGESISGEETDEAKQLISLAMCAAAKDRQSPPHMRQDGFSPKHQAIMFGLLARDIFALYGQQRGRQLLERAVTRYGNERGSRMARRALQNGDPLDMASYFAYGEWSWKGGFTQSVIQKEPYYAERIDGCPWYAGWEESGLSEYGQYYCRGVDAALLQGFHPALRLEVPFISGVSGCSYCEFHWKDAVMTQEMEQRQRQIEQRLAGSGKKDFIYHTAHLYATLTHCAKQEDEAAGRQLVRQIWQEFSAFTSCRELWQVLAQANTDFTRI